MVYFINQFLIIDLWRNDKHSLCLLLVVKKKKKGKVKRITPSPKTKSTNRKRSVSSGSAQGVQHKRVKHLKGKDRRGSISTSTPIAKDGRRRSVGFAFTPSPGGRNGNHLL